MTDGTAMPGVVVRMAGSERDQLRNQDREQKQDCQRPGDFTAA
jgi:hypothetical protein